MAAAAVAALGKANATLNSHHLVDSGMLSSSSASFLSDARETLLVAVMVALFVVSLIGQMTYFTQTPPSEFKRRSPAAKDDEALVWREHLGKAVARPAESEALVRRRKELGNPSVTWAEVKKHQSREDLWLVIDGKAFDVTTFVARHPGGWRPMVHSAGKDGTEAFHEFHPAAVADRWLPQFFVGDVSDYEVTPLVRDFRALRQELLARGFFENTHSYYVAKYVWLASIFVPSLYLALRCESTLAHLCSAALMALFWQQLAFVGHDLGHNSVTHHRETDLFWGGLIGDMLGGVGLAWWKLSHNTHHTVCNSVEHDPDIQHLPALAVSDKIFGKFWSTFHERFFVTDAAARLLVSYQHLLFYPIMALARFNLIVQSWIVLLSKEHVQYRYTEMFGLLAFFGWYSALLASLPTNGERIMYALTSFGLAGILHVQICISHFSMDVFTGTSPDDWIRHQMSTTMDVDCPLAMDWFHGGLQFQVVHHLWPRLPRRHLRVARARLLELCAKHDVRYVEMGFVDANKRLVQRLRETAAAARKLKRGDGGFFESPIWEGLNAQG